jgi:hypothetical protein
MTDISSCPKCGATVTVDKFEEGDPMGVFCKDCGFAYFVPQEVDTVEELIASWNSQPVIEKLRAEVEEFKYKQNAIEQYIKDYPAGEDADPEMRSFHTAIKNIFAGKYDDLWRPLPPDALP